MFLRLTILCWVLIIGIMPIVAAISCRSSAETIDSCRTFRISVPRGCWDVTREQDGRVKPEWLSPSGPENRIINSVCGTVQRSECRSGTKPSQVILAENFVGISAGIVTLRPMIGKTYYNRPQTQCPVQKQNPRR